MVSAEMNSSWGRLSEDGGMRFVGQEGKNSAQMRTRAFGEAAEAREGVRIGRRARARRC
jgi:hypothetical protein